MTKSNLPSKWQQFLIELRATLASKESNLPPKWKRISRVVIGVLFLAMAVGYVIVAIDNWYRYSASAPIPNGEVIGGITILISINSLIIYFLTVEYIFHKRRFLSSQSSEDEDPPSGK